MGEEVREGFLEEELFLLKVKCLFIVASVTSGIDEHFLCASLYPEGGEGGNQGGCKCPFLFSF